MKTNRVGLLFILLLAFVFAVLSVDARASGDRIQTSGDINQHIDVGGTFVEGSSMTGGDVTVSGDKNRAYALGLGDVDINDCYRSFQIAVLFQGSQLNYWCMADSLDAKGLHAAAAMTRCKLDGYRALFNNDMDYCIDMNTMAAFVPPPPPEPAAIDKDEEDDYHAELETAVAMLREEFERTQAQASEAKRVAQEAAQTPQTIIQKEEFLDDEQRIKLEAIKHEKVDQ